MISIRATCIDDTWVGYVEENGRVLATVMNPLWLCDQDALRGATAKRSVIEAEREALTRRVANRKPYWNGIDWICTCGTEVVSGRCDNGHRWRSNDGKWERVDG